MDFELWKIVGNVEEPSTLEQIKTVVFICFHGCLVLAALTIPVTRVWKWVAKEIWTALF